MRKYWWLLALPVALIVWWAFGRGNAPVEVHFATVKRARISSAVPTNGKVEPAEWSAARAETASIVRAINVQRGDKVQKGQTLVTLDQTAAQATLAAALARQQEAQAEIDTLSQGGKASTVADINDRIRSAEAAVQMAQRIYDSDKRLFQQHAITQLQLTTDADALDRAKLNLTALQNQKKSSVTTLDRTVADAKLRDARAAVALAQRDVRLTEVKSPMSGTVYEFDLKVGAYLEPGKLIALIGNLDQVKVLVYVDEPDLGRVGLNMPVTITSDSRPGQKWSGRVDKLPTQIIALSSRTVGEVTTIIDNTGHELLPGVSVYASIVSQVVPDAVIIPKPALRRQGTADGAFVLNGKSLIWRPVHTGISDINNVQIVSGLAPGEHVADRIVDPPDAEIRNGMRVNPVF